MKMVDRTAQGLLADTGAAISATGAGYTWISQANDIMQLIATAVAIIAGVYAIKWHRVRIKHAQEKSRGKDKS